MHFVLTFTGVTNTQNQVELDPEYLPKWPFLVRIRYFCVFFEVLRSDITGIDYPKHFVLTRTGVTNTQNQV